MTNNTLMPNVGLRVQPDRQEPGWISATFKRWLVENLRNARKILYQDVSTYTTVTTNPTDLGSYAIPANMLEQNGHGLKFLITGNHAATANNKTLTVVWGGVTIFTSGAVAANNKQFVVEGTIYRTGPATQEINTWGTVVNSAVVDGGRTAGVADLTVAQILKVNVTDATAAGGTIQRTALIEKLDNFDYANGR